MSHTVSIRPNPFRFLLHTEWGLLATCVVADSLPSLVFSQSSHLSIPPLLILVLFGLMGLILPSSNVAYKVLHTSIEISLILFGVAFGYLQLWPMLLIIVVIRSCFVFDLSRRRLVAGLVFFLFLVLQIQFDSSIALSMTLPEQGRFWLYQLTNTLLFGVGLLFVLKLVNMILTECHTQKQLTIAHEQLQRYALQIEEFAAVRERNRIVYDIHHSLGHALTALNIQLQSALKLWQVDPDQAQTFLIQSKQLGSVAMQEVRCSVRTLSADVPKEEPLIQSWKHPTLKESFVHQCQQDLADLIGPIAMTLVQKVLRSSPQLSPDELVQVLATEIVDAKKADEFQQRLLFNSNSSNLMTSESGLRVSKR